MHEELLNLVIGKKYTILEVMKKLDLSAKKILLVVESKKLTGVITDGDIRRWILKNGDLNAPVSLVMNKNPVVLKTKEKHKAIKSMRKHNIEAIPLIGSDGCLESIVFWNEFNEEKLTSREKLSAPVVIMAGGKGTRLYPYTKILPKPLIPIGDTPIVERIINKLYEFGCCNFYLTVNYKKNMIKSYFSDIEKNYRITYIEEEQPLGTGGSLFMLKDKIDSTFFVSNCDILVDADYSDILEYHKMHENKITMVTSIKTFEVPYGVIKLNEEGQVNRVIEKPNHTYLVNTGFYVMEADTLRDIPENQFYNLPDLYEYYLNTGQKVGVYPISEGSWMDMGQMDNLKDMLRRLNMEE